MRVLAVRFGRIGDVLFTTPALARLKEAWPGARIDYCTRAALAPLVAGHPAVTEVLPFEPGAYRPTHGWRRRALRREIARRGYDAALVFESDRPTRTWLEELCRAAGVERVVSRSDLIRRGALPRGAHSCERHQALLSLLGVEPAPRPYALHPRPGDRAAAMRLLAAKGVGEDDAAPLIGLQAGSHYSMWPGARLLPGLRHKFHKSWPEAHWRALGSLLVEKLGARLVLLGAGDERRAARALARAIPAPPGREPVVVAGETSVGALAGLVARLDLLVSVDTGPMHVAAASGVPTVALFGPTNPAHHGPYGRPGASVVLRTGIACSPCRKVVRKACPANLCLSGLAPERVLAASAALLERAQSLRAASEAPGR